jgi:glycopeptide antibiotics resistance protein
MPFIYSTINWKRIFVLAVLAGLLIETIQALFHIGIFDIDDVILNGLGVIIGFWKYNLYTGFSISIKKITSVITFTILGSLFTLYFIASFKIIQLPFGLEPSITKQKQLNSNLKDTHTDCCDLCNGTGGTGGIIAIGDNDITIKRRDGKQEIIKLSNKTIIKNSAGPIAKSDLRIGDRVTLVINDAEIASLILVCGIKN